MRTVHTVYYSDKKIEADQESMRFCHPIDGLVSQQVEMKSTIVTCLIDDIVESVYPDPHLVRERYVLSQLLHLLVFLVRRKSRSDQNASIQIMKAAISKMMQVGKS
jgi:hypothetical protein